MAPSSGALLLAAVLLCASPLDVLTAPGGNGGGGGGGGGAGGGGAGVGAGTGGTGVVPPGISDSNAGGGGAAAGNNLPAVVAANIISDPTADPTLDAVQAGAAVSAGSDPIFVGWNGQMYYAKGEHGKAFAVLSAPGVQVNGLTTMGLEKNPNVLWFSAIGIKTGGGFEVALEVPRDAGFEEGDPTYRLTINGRDLTERLFTGLEDDFGGGARVRYFRREDAFAYPSTSPTGGKGTSHNTLLLDVTTPLFKMEVKMAIDDAPWEHHLPTPHLDVSFTQLVEIPPSVVGGMLGESMLWPSGRKVPFDRGFLKSKDDLQYEVSGLLAHDFAYSTFEEPLPLATASAGGSSVGMRRKLLQAKLRGGAAAAAAQRSLARLEVPRVARAL